MKGKVSPPIMPFHHCPKINWYDRIKITICAILLFPFRVVLVVLSILVAWVTGCIGTYGLSFDDLCNEPPKTRLSLGHLAGRHILRCGFFFLGFLWVKVKGRKASVKEAPVLVVAPHSSVFDALPIVLMGCSIVAKSSIHTMPIIGKIIDLAQPVYIRRENSNSRQVAIKEIVKRARSYGRWPQMAIFPEGTCTNRTCLATFKAGAFYPGVPVQPVIVRWSNRCDTVTWTWDGIPAWKVLLFTMCQFINFCSLEYLPVYTPSDAERADPFLYAENVQKHLAKAMGIPATDYGLVHGKLLQEMRDTYSFLIIRRLTLIRKLRARYGNPKVSDLEIQTVKDALRNPEGKKWVVDVKEFAQLFNIPFSNKESIRKEISLLFALFDGKNSGLLDLREYLAYVFFLQTSMSPDKMSLILFMLYGSTSALPRSVIVHMLQVLFLLPESQGEGLLQKVQKPDGDSEDVDLGTFQRILDKRLEFIRLFAMEVNGEL